MPKEFRLALLEEAQTDGLVEKFNSTLISMIAIPYLLFGNKVSAQKSTQEFPFFLLYGRDACLLMESGLSYHRRPYATEMFPGKDAKVRVAMLKTSTSILKRPVTKLALIL